MIKVREAKTANRMKIMERSTEFAEIGGNMQCASLA